jgi:hypothetical protein
MSNREFDKLVPVNHQSPDFDSAMTTFLRLLADGVALQDPRLEYVFVPAGQRYTPEHIDPKTIVTHLDTGYIYDPKTDDYDHHQDRERWPSAARTVMEAHPHLQSDPIVQDMVHLTDRVDSGSTVNREASDARQIREALNNQILNFNRGRDEKVILITEQNGPWQIADLVQNLEIELTEINDHDKLVASLIMLDNWYKNEQAERAGLESERNLDRSIFDRVAATFLHLIAQDRWLYDLEYSELEHIYQSSSSGFMSLTEATYSKLSVLHGDPVVEEIVALVNLLITKNTTLRENDETRAFKKDLADKLAGFNDGRDNVVYPITLRKGPWEVAELFPGDEYPLQVRILSGLIMFRAWWNKKTVRGRVQELINSSHLVTYGGLRFCLIPETTFTSKAIRYQLRRYFRDEIDVAVATYVDKGNDNKSVGITRVMDRTVFGMERLYRHLCRLDPEASLFLFRPSKFVIYIKNKLDILTPERVLQEASHHLRPYRSKRLILRGDPGYSLVTTPTTEQVALVLNAS